MDRVGVFVGEQGNWSFFREIFEDLRAHYHTSVYEPKVYRTPMLHGRLNGWALRDRVRTILKQSNVGFFEWASELLEVATRMPKYCPIVTRLHAYELYAWGPRIQWDAVDRVILVSQAMRNNFIEEYPAHAGKTIVVPNAVRLDQFRPGVRTGSTLNLGMLCSFYPRKRVYETILMFSKFHGRYPDARLYLGGGRIHAADSDEYYIACCRLVKKLGLEDAVHFDGPIARPAEWLPKIDVFISNSFWEGQQVALLEALASGCYCLSHAWAGAEEVLPPEFLCQTDDELFQKTMEYAALSLTEREARRARLRQIASSEFDVESQKQRVREILESTIARR
jgi:glycosyltransferase involved in cell wall biosynthesis